jgi:hypothetical protein
MIHNWGFCIGDREPFNSTRYTAMLVRSDVDELEWSILNIEDQRVCGVTMLRAVLEAAEGASMEHHARRHIVDQVKGWHHGQK